MSKRIKRTREEKIAHLERSIKKFGDPDGSRGEALAILRKGKAKK